MNKKVFYLLYILISSIVNILFTALIIGSLFGICLVFLKFVFHAASFEAYGNALFGSFTIGLVLSFFSENFLKKVRLFCIQKSRQKL